MGVWDPILRKDVEAEGAKAVSLRWTDTDKGGAGRPNYTSQLVVREVKKAMKNLIFALQLDFSAEYHLWKVWKHCPLCSPLTVKKKRKQADRCNVRHQPCALPWSTSAKSVCGTHR